VEAARLRVFPEVMMTTDNIGMMRCGRCRKTLPANWLDDGVCAYCRGDTSTVSQEDRIVRVEKRVRALEKENENRLRDRCDIWEYLNGVGSVWEKLRVIERKIYKKKDVNNGQ